MIEIADLRKRLGARTVLDGISLSIGRGEVVALTGPSGSGKTTLLRCLNGLERADEGTIRIGKSELPPATVEDPRALREVRRKVGLVFQQWNLFAHHTVLQNVMEGPVHVAGRPPDQARTRARELLDRVGLSHREDARPDQLSGGEQQRAAIARAMAMDPEVLLLDEPTSALDPRRVEELNQILRGLVEGGLTVVAVTHDQRFARALATRMLVLEGGKITRDGTPAEVLGASHGPHPHP
jgi:polar amino acid transport system ATP-binding protein